MQVGEGQTKQDLNIPTGLNLFIDQDALHWI